MIVEICCGSYEDAINAYDNGIKRIELNSALHLGGLTPSISTLRLLKRETNLEIVCMVRPRGAGFHYTEMEYIQMKEELIDLLHVGADGIAFGFLNNDLSIDISRTKEFVDIIHSYGKTAVFHRAFDCTTDGEASLKLLIKLGVDRVLTSGFENTAINGMENIRYLQQKYNNLIEILPGSGINANNVKSFIEYTGVSQIHSSCRVYMDDITTSSNKVSYSYLEFPNHNKYDYVSSNLVKALIDYVK